MSQKLLSGEANALAPQDGIQLAPNVASDPTFGYYKLTADQIKKEYATLDGEVNQRCEVIAQTKVTLEEAQPYIAKMQALLSQRGKERSKVLKEAGVPTWTQWAKSYTKKLDCSFRTIQRHIKNLRFTTTSGAKDQAGKVPKARIQGPTEKTKYLPSPTESSRKSSPETEFPNADLPSDFSGLLEWCDDTARPRLEKVCRSLDQKTETCRS
jgi:hypothetical protein